MKIAIIEDDVAIGFSLKLALEDKGHAVVVYDDPVSVPYGALDVDVLLLDYYMPRLNGEQVLGKLRESQDVSKMRIFLMSAFPHMADLAKQLDVQLLPKPFDLDTLYRCIEAP